ncbi:nucleotidyltransferase family protein [Caldisphaera lagunensis DSM 15908]|uniref:Nucleotidyltransferase family protein n=1 Tax=Caldisphaera lagunensis (strain DSM 15908 / JCM 11604 / ANMR 0165 / IC-154) TaxID=1056495 RepID=L0ADD7_CALLD|nr:nucleotidyltransferase domain-containing protein [Caldisphaera lagunensis]AFZ71065.1 nucleotidyltransferase family protein [Caldisphaera lagunensis DSM 15908]
MILSRFGHDSTIITKDLIIGVEIGIQSPEGLIPIIPKYVSCNKSSWKRHTLNFCRILLEYGPSGISDAIKNSKIKMIYDPIYRTQMPYIKQENILIYNNPKSVFKEIFLNSSNGLRYNEESIFNLINELDIDNIGITGSYALGMQFEGSDIDLVIYGEKNSELFYDIFKNKAKIIECKNSFGGVIINGPCIPWRRGLYKNKAYSWTGVPENIASHCNALNNYNRIEIPNKVKDLNITIPEGQIGALLYPPCVKDVNGRYVISFEYNAGYLLYMGGNLKISGLSNEKIIVIGVREYPGKISTQ